MRTVKFPGVIYVTREEPGGNEEPYLVAHEDGLESVEDGDEVAIYKLAERGDVLVSRQYVKRPKKKP